MQAFFRVSGPNNLHHRSVVASPACDASVDVVLDVIGVAPHRAAANAETGASEAWREWARLSEGCYVLRSNVRDWSSEDLWRADIQLTEAEAAFHIHKSDL